MAFCYFNGEILEEEKASISIHNLGLHRSFGIFDFFRARAGKPTFFEDYLDRFDQSQRSLQLSKLIAKEEVRSAVSKLLELNRFENSSFKLILLGTGSDMDEALEPLFYIIHAPHFSEPGIKVGNLISHEYVRENALIKNLNYFASYQLHQRKIAAKAVDVLYHHNGVVSEASRSNIFIIKKGIVLTPESNILHGITRKHILKMMEGSVEYVIRDFSLDDVLSADEVFLSSTLKELMPIVKVDDIQIGDANPGPITSKLYEQFQDYIESYNS
jgi:branched-subunit amino acid aminotransferase/4-amino-4-deoxychorismate lyase